MRSTLRLSSPLMRYAAMALDALLVVICATGAYAWRIGPVLPTQMPLLYILVTLVAVLVLMLFANNIYRSWRVNALWVMMQAVATGWLAAVVAVVFCLFLSKSSSEVSRLWFISWTISTLVALCLLRWATYLVLRLLRHLGYNFKTVLLVGEGPALVQVRQVLANAVWSGMRVQAEVAVGDLTAWLAGSAQRPPDEVWLCLSVCDRADIEGAMNALRYTTANIRLVPDWYSLRLINQGVSDVLGLTMLDLSTSPVTGTMRVVKTFEDRLGALIILTVIGLPMLVIALAVKLTSPGPVLFKQRRHGWNGQKIWVYKFRSMVVHHEPDFQVTQAHKHDARVTPLGAFLRRTSLDELPQFINVLQGRLSIVGPRPHAVQHNEHYKQLVPGYMLRHKVKPGVTGWAQINGLRGETDTLEKMQKRVEYDIYYIEHLSLWFDLKIIFATMFHGWVDPNAY